MKHRKRLREPTNGTILRPDHVKGLRSMSSTAQAAASIDSFGPEAHLLRDLATYVVTRKS